MDAIDSIPAKTPMCYVDSLFRFDIDGHMSCHVTSPSSLCDGWLRGWVSADQFPLSRAMRSRLAPDW